MDRPKVALCVVLKTLAVASACAPAISGGDPANDFVTFAGEPIRFDDIGYDPSLDRILAPALEHGLKLVDPTTLEVTTLDDDADSVDAGEGFLFVLDRRGGELRVITADTMTLVGSFATGGDYVRYVESEREVWVTDPGAGRVLVLGLADDGVLTLKVPISILGGPEGLTVDAERGIAVSHYFGGDAVVFDLAAGQVARQPGTGCLGAHGVPALDIAGGFAFFGCRNAEIVSVDVDTGEQRGRYHLGGGGESLMAFDPASRRAFVRGDPGEVIAVVDVGTDGALTEVGSRTASDRGHCLLVAAGSLWACDEVNGGLQRFDLDEEPTEADGER